MTPDDGPVLCHMSGRPTTEISHRAGERRAYGSAIVFVLADETEPLTPDALLARLDGWKRRPWSRINATAALRARLDAHARTLFLPPAAVVSDRATAGDRVEDDLLTVCTVLAKSSARVYLRDKEPNLAAIRPGRRVVLLVPPSGRLR